MRWITLFLTQRSILIFFYCYNTKIVFEVNYEERRFILFLPCNFAQFQFLLLVVANCNWIEKNSLRPLSVSTELGSGPRTWLLSGGFANCPSPHSWDRRSWLACGGIPPWRRPSTPKRTSGASARRCAKHAWQRSWKSNRRSNRRGNAGRSTRFLDLRIPFLFRGGPCG